MSAPIDPNVARRDRCDHAYKRMLSGDLTCPTCSLPIDRAGLQFVGDTITTTCARRHVSTVDDT
jgi:hypothetical protein